MPEKTAGEITKASRSNLALSFISLPREKRDDITTFYAFCRVVDDIADSPEFSDDEKRARLNAWRATLGLLGESHPEPPLASPVRQLLSKYPIDPALLGEIITGCEMDVGTVRYHSFSQLREYCYRVASAVGLVSIEIFGYKNPRCRDYAVALGIALQLTNILRDVAQDFANGSRIYLPQEDIARFGYSIEDLRVGRYDERFASLMEFEAARARSFYDDATAGLPPEDRRSMQPAEIMRRVYRRLLERMARDRFRVLEKRYAPGIADKAAAIARSFW